MKEEIRLVLGVVPTQGWYGTERFDNRNVRWTKRAFAWRQPGGAGLRSKIWYWVPELAGVPSLQATVFAGGQRIGGFPIRKGWNEGFFELPATTALYRDCSVELDRGWVPASCGVGADSREVGLLVEAIEAIEEIPPPPPPGLFERIRRRVDREWARAPLSPAVRAELGELRGEVARLRERLDRSPVGYPPSLELEDLARGPRELVLERLRRYLSRFAGKWNILDLGCGRGELLELLEESGAGGWGVESSPVFAEECRHRGLRVVEEDPHAYLETLPDRSLDGIFCARLIERISGPERRELLRSAQEKLAPGGFLLLETPNPKNLAVAADSFWLDPTRVAPVPPELLAWELSQLGYELAEILYADGERGERRLAALPAETPGLESLSQWRESLDELLFGARLYALIARRPA